MVAFPAEILTRAKELIPILSSNMKVNRAPFCMQYVERARKEMNSWLVLKEKE